MASSTATIDGGEIPGAAGSRHLSGAVDRTGAGAPGSGASAERQYFEMNESSAGSAGSLNFSCAPQALTAIELSRPGYGERIA